MPPSLQTQESFLRGYARRYFLLHLLVILMLLFAFGCGQRPEKTVVDFSKTKTIQKPLGMSQNSSSLRVAVGAMISPKETFVFYRQLLEYIGRKLGREVELVQRKTYGEINELLGEGQIDLAFICSGPYAVGREKYGLELLSTPQIQGSYYYRSYLIVNKDTRFQKLEDLRGRVFAFTDSDSNTGKLVPTYWLAQIGESPEPFFRKVIYTHSHDNSIMAVGRALVDGAAVDGLIWEYYHKKSPAFTAETRIIKKSEPYGIPPLVASRYLDPETKERIRQLFLSMHMEAEGQNILKALMIDKFLIPQDGWYEGIRRMVTMMASQEEERRASKKP
jgi:phosphonate transport system substrate-binding protein